MMKLGIVICNIIRIEFEVNLNGIAMSKKLEQTCVAIGKQVQQARKSWNFEWEGIVFYSQLLGSFSKNIVLFLIYLFVTRHEVHIINTHALHNARW